MTKKKQLPDEEDKKNIQNMLKNYELTHPGEIQAVIDDTRQLPSAGKKTPIGNYLMELPEDLAETFRLTYPDIFRDKDQFNWFKENFSELFL